MFLFVLLLAPLRPLALRSGKAAALPYRIQIEILAEICPNTVVMWPLGNIHLNCALRSAAGPQPCPGGERRPGGAPGLQNQRGAQQSPRWVRFPSASANLKRLKAKGQMLKYRNQIFTPLMFQPLAFSL